MPSPNTIEKIADRVQIGDPADCWPWLGHIAKSGYGQVSFSSRMHMAHRLIYELAVEKVDASLDLDHLCRNRACCNPDHLEPVDRQTNVLRGRGLAAQNAAKTHCRQGHPYSPENTRIGKGRSGLGCRICKTCEQEWQRRYKQRRSTSS